MFADILNRIRIGEHTEDDLNALEIRVRPEGHPDLKGALVIACKHVDVNRHNTICLSELKTELITTKSVNSHANLKNFKPKIDKKKLTVGTTSYLETLYLKVGARVMLTINLDVNDGLANGSLGTLMAATKDDNGKFDVLFVMFDDQRCGREMRRYNPQFSKRFPGCTPIKLQIHKYSTSKSSKGSRVESAIVQQFPLILSFASTSHKIQGITVEAPKKVAVGLRTVWGPSQAYVMLGRCQQLSQLYIIGNHPRNKILCDPTALKQLNTLKSKSINQNPPVFEKTFPTSLKVAFLNIHSLLDKIKDIRADPIVHFGDLVIFGEIWIHSTSGENVTSSSENFSATTPKLNIPTNTNFHSSQESLDLDGYKLHLNSKGRGKGLAVYFKDNKFVLQSKYSDKNLQISLFTGEDLVVLAVYRSSLDENLDKVLKKTIYLETSYLIIGDLNICSKRRSNHPVFQSLKSLGFKLLVNRGK